MSFPKFVNMTKNTPFFWILLVFAPLNDVCAYIAWSWKTTLITWIFLRGWYPTSNTSGPTGDWETNMEKKSGGVLFSFSFYVIASFWFAQRMILGWLECQFHSCAHASNLSSVGPPSADYNTQKDLTTVVMRTQRLMSLLLQNPSVMQIESSQLSVVVTQLWSQAFETWRASSSTHKWK